MIVFDLEGIPFARDLEVGVVVRLGCLRVTIKQEVSRRPLGGHIGEEKQPAAQQLVLAVHEMHLARHDF